jgi:hypothetical protein
MITDFKQLPYFQQRDFEDPYLRNDKKSYHPLLKEEGHPWDTCMISSRAGHLWFLRELLPESNLKTYSKERIEEVYFQMICDYLEDNYLKKGKEVSRYNSTYHSEMLNNNFKANGIPFKYVNCKATIENARKITTGQMPNAPAQPVIVGTDISNFIKLKQNESPYRNGKGNPKGHIQLFVEVRSDGIISKDPYGKAFTSYKDHNGDNVLYLNKHLDLLLADYCLMVYVVKI